MDRLIEDKISFIERLCQQYDVERMDVFGSAAEGRFDPTRSDLDFLVRFKTCDPGEHYERYFGLLEALHALFDRSIDLVEIDAMRNPYFIREVNRSRSCVYGERPREISVRRA